MPARPFSCMAVRIPRLAAAAALLALAACGGRNGKWPDLAAPLPETEGPSRLHAQFAPLPETQPQIPSAAIMTPAELDAGEKGAGKALETAWAAFGKMRAALKPPVTPSLYYDAEQALSRLGREAARYDALSDAALAAGDRARAEALAGQAEQALARIRSERESLAALAPQ